MSKCNCIYVVHCVKTIWQIPYIKLFFLKIFNWFSIICFVHYYLWQNTKYIQTVLKDKYPQNGDHFIGLQKHLICSWFDAVQKVRTMIQPGHTCNILRIR